MKKVKKNPLEWAVFGISALVILMLLSYLGYASLIINEQSPPDIIVETGKPIQQSGKFLVPVTVKNNGEQTAEDVNVEVSLSKEGIEMEESEVVIAFIPRHSEKEGWVVFITDPASADKIFSYAKGFNKP